MGKIRTGTVGYSYREWLGSFYPTGTHPRRQLQLYSENFSICELNQFTHQMPDIERVERFCAQIKGDLKFFVRLHNTFTQCADIGLALTLSRHFRRALEPMYQSGKLAGLVAPFPYAFKDSAERRMYIEELAETLEFEGIPLQLDFRHPSWMVEEAFGWMRQKKLGFVCVDEPQLPGLILPHVVATSDHVLIRLHGRNAEGWWSGNPATRYDYSYSAAELDQLEDRYLPIVEKAAEVSFVFQNNWEAHSVRNAIDWKARFERRIQLLGQGAFGVELPSQSGPVIDPATSIRPASAPAVTGIDDSYDDDENSRPRTSLPLAELKSRVSQALSPLQQSLTLPLRTRS